MSQISKNISVSGGNSSVAVVNPSVYPYQIKPADYYVIVNSSMASNSVLLPANPVTGNRYFVVDGSGDAATNPIIVEGNGNTIISQTEYIIQSNYGFVGFLFDVTEWKVINQ